MGVKNNRVLKKTWKKTTLGWKEQWKVADNMLSVRKHSYTLPSSISIAKSVARYDA